MVEQSGWGGTPSQGLLRIRKGQPEDVPPHIPDTPFGSLGSTGSWHRFDLPGGGFIPTPGTPYWLVLYHQFAVSHRAGSGGHLGVATQGPGVNFPNYGNSITTTNAVIGFEVYQQVSAPQPLELISVARSATAQPAEATLAILANSAVSTLKGYVSRDDGATWTQVTLSSAMGYDSGRSLFVGSASLAGQGTDLRWRITGAANDPTEIHAVGLQWR